MRCQICWKNVGKARLAAFFCRSSVTTPSRDSADVIGVTRTYTVLPANAFSCKPFSKVTVGEKRLFTSGSSVSQPQSCVNPASHDFHHSCLLGVQLTPIDDRASHFRPGGLSLPATLIKCHSSSQSVSHIGAVHHEILEAGIPSAPKLRDLDRHNRSIPSIFVREEQLSPI
jgi:hypothetical protein